LLIAALTGAGACSNAPTVPTTPAPTSQTLIFSSRLTTGGVAWKQFNVTATGNVTIRLAVLSPDDTLVMRLSLGSFDGTTCTPTNVVDTPTGDDPQLTVPVTIGRYCVQISDIGNLTRINDFGIIVVIPL